MMPLPSDSPDGARSGRSVAWYARLLGVQEVVSSNLTAPTILIFRRTAPGIFTFFLNHARSSSSHSCSQSVIAPLPSSRYATVNKPSAEPDRSSWRATVYRMYIYSAQRPDLGTPGQ